MSFSVSSTDIQLTTPPGQGITLQAMCEDALGQPQLATYDLNSVFGVSEGKFKPNCSGFQTYAKPGSIKLLMDKNGTSVYLHADLKLLKARGENKYNHSSIDLNKYFTNTGGKLVPVRSRTLVLFFDGTTNKVCRVLLSIVSWILIHIVQQFGTDVRDQVI